MKLVLDLRFLQDFKIFLDFYYFDNSSHLTCFM